jgi:flavin reductase (DIM6/NTAB) family NADH-FMN oxidoreductase RutF
MPKVSVPNAVFSALPVIIAGSMIEGRINFVTLACFGMLSSGSRVYVYIGSRRAHETNVGVRQHGVYSVNVPSADLLEKTDYVGLVSGRNVDKAALFTTFFGADDKAPMIEECRFNAVCRVVQTIEVGGNDVFIGKIVEAFVDEDCMFEGQPDLARIQPLFLGGSSRGADYWGIGEPVGRAFEIGRALIADPTATTRPPLHGPRD